MGIGALNPGSHKNASTRGGLYIEMRDLAARIAYHEVAVEELKGRRDYRLGRAGRDR